MRAPSHLCAKSRWSSLWSRWRRRAVLRCWLLIAFARPWPCCRREVYDRPDHDVKIVGITGTKGKTTAAFMLQSIIKAAGESCGMIGSVSTDDGIECYESTNTTPEAPEVWRHIANCRESGRQSMVMEVSSQALKYQRVENLPFDVACFLNIGRDHISPIEHPTFEDYFESKLRIFDQAKTAVVNLGTEEVDRVLEAASTAERLVTVGVEHP